MKKFAFAAMISAVALLGTAGTTFAARAPEGFVLEQATSRGPQSFQIFCMFNPDECKPGGSSKVTLNEDVLRVIGQVNARVNRSIRPKLDGAVQIWRINPSAGDCKSYTISKRHELIKAGLPASALRIAYVKTRDGIDHAVLVVKTNRGDLTLDNLTGDIVQFNQTGYHVVSMAGADPRRWS